MKIIFVNPEATMKTFGTLEYALDKYSGQWTWKLKGKRAVMMASKIIPQLWYGDGPNEAIIPDNYNNVKQLKWIFEPIPNGNFSKICLAKKNFAKNCKKNKSEQN